MLRRNEEVGIRRALGFEVEGVTGWAVRGLDEENKWRKTESGVTGC